MEDNKQRLFIAVPIGAEAIAEISSLIEGLRKGFKFINVPMTWTKPETIHLTLQFLGDTPSREVPEIVDVVGQIAKQYGPLNLKVHEIGVFPNWKRPRVLWVGVGISGTRLGELQAQIWNSTERFAEKKEENRFQPHLTIGRFKSFAGMDTAKNIVIGHRRFKTCHFTATELVLYRSELSTTGARHFEVHRFPLAEDNKSLQNDHQLHDN